MFFRRIFRRIAHKFPHAAAKFPAQVRIFQQTVVPGEQGHVAVDQIKVRFAESFRRQFPPQSFLQAAISFQLLFAEVGKAFAQAVFVVFAVKIKDVAADGKAFGRQQGFRPEAQVFPDKGGKRKLQPPFADHPRTVELAGGGAVDVIEQVFAFCVAKRPVAEPAVKFVKQRAPVIQFVFAGRIVKQQNVRLQTFRFKAKVTECLPVDSVVGVDKRQITPPRGFDAAVAGGGNAGVFLMNDFQPPVAGCLLYTSDAADDR